MRVLQAIFVMVMMILFIVFISGRISPPLSEGQQVRSYEQARRTDNVEKAKADIRAKLKDPESAQFKDIYVPNGITVCGMVNAKNSSGVYTGYKAFYSFTMNDVNSYLEGRADESGKIVSNDDFTKEFKGACNEDIYTVDQYAARTLKMSKAKRQEAADDAAK